MLYRLFTYVSGNPPYIDDSGNRNAACNATPAQLMQIMNLQDSPIPAKFQANSKTKVLRMRVLPVGAPGLREGLELIPFRGNFYFGQENFNIKLSKFDEWQDCNVILEAQTMLPGIFLYAFSAHYDAFQIKEEYKGLNFAFRVEVEIETSAEFIP